MFHLFPNSRQEWLRVLVFPFQAYVVVAVFVEQYFWELLPGNGGYRGAMFGFNAMVLLGYIFCILMLLGLGFAFLLTGRRRSGWLNLALAALGALFAYSTLGHFMVT
jgi:hypothetical protein